MLKNEDFVKVRDYIPDIEVELKYATNDNFTKTVIYDFHEAYLRYGTVVKLKKAQHDLKKEGYGIKIWDAFRPVEAQFRLWDVYPDPTFVANPNSGYSNHSRGNTVDITLVTLDGKYVQMPTGFDDFSDQAKRGCIWVSPEGKKNSMMLEAVMTKYGFIPNPNEWWHYSDEEEYLVERAFRPEL